MKKIEYVTAKELSVRLGVSAEAVGQHIRAGRLKKSVKKTGTGRQTRYRIDYQAAVKELEANIDPQYLVNKPTGGGKKKKAPAKGARKKAPAPKKAAKGRVKAPAKTAPAKPGEATASTFTEARTATEQYKAKMRRLEYEKASGLLVEKAQVEKDAFDVARILRDSLMVIPDRVDAILAAETDQQAVNEILRKEIKAALVDAIGKF